MRHHLLQVLAPGKSLSRSDKLSSATERSEALSQAHCTPGSTGALFDRWRHQSHPETARAPTSPASRILAKMLSCHYSLDARKEGGLRCPIPQSPEQGVLCHSAICWPE